VGYCIFDFGGAGRGIGRRRLKMQGVRILTFSAQKSLCVAEKLYYSPSRLTPPFAWGDTRLVIIFKSGTTTSPANRLCVTSANIHRTIIELSHKSVNIMFRRHSWPSFNVSSATLSIAQPVDHVWRVISNQ